jgi:hypothetical protein
VVKIGDPYKFGELYGRVTGKEGGIITFATPYGSVLKLGLVWFGRDAKLITEWEDLNALFELDQQAITAGKKLYGGLLT